MRWRGWGTRGDLLIFYLGGLRALRLSDGAETWRTRLVLPPHPSGVSPVFHYPLGGARLLRVGTQGTELSAVHVDVAVRNEDGSILQREYFYSPRAGFWETKESDQVVVAGVTLTPRDGTVTLSEPDRFTSAPEASIWVCDDEQWVVVSESLFEEVRRRHPSIALRLVPGRSGERTVGLTANESGEASALTYVDGVVKSNDACWDVGERVIDAMGTKEGLLVHTESDDAKTSRIELYAGPPLTACTLWRYPRPTPP